MFNSTADITQGAETQFGTIERVSLTAAMIAGEWVPFTKLVTTQRAVALAIPQVMVDAVTDEMSAAFRAASDTNVAALTR